MAETRIENPGLQQSSLEVGEAGNRKLEGWSLRTSSGIKVLWSLFQIAAALSLFFMTPGAFRSIHLMFGSVLAFFIYQSHHREKSRHRIPWYDMGFVISCVAIAAYNFWYFELDQANLAYKSGTITGYEMLLALLLLIATLESTRRVVGWVLPTLALVSLFYALYANLFPGFLQGRGVSLERLLSYLYLSGNGVYSQLLGVSAQHVFPFVLFAAFFTLSGVGKMFIDLSVALFGRYSGGPAKVSIVASGMFGSISGSAVSNVMTTGAFTIPMMKRIGLPPSYAGAVEAVASTGGTIMPPFMGAAAFIMADYMGVPYGQIVVAAAIPAVLYYWALYQQINYRAKRMNLKGLSLDQIPDAKEVLKKGWYLLLPIMLLIYLLVFENFPAQRAAIWGIASILVVTSFRAETRFNLRKLCKALELGAQNSVQIVVAVGTVSIFSAVIQLTGLGVNLSQGLLLLSGNSLPVLLALTMVASLILGMGLTASACYITLAILVAPSLIKMGVEPIAAHMFLFYFGNISFITPPVAIASYAAAALAGANIMKTGWTAFRLGITAFIVPYMFVYGPELLALGNLFNVLFGFVTALVGVWCLAVGLEGFLWRGMTWWERGPFFVATFLLMVPHVVLSTIGIAVFFAALLLHRIVTKRWDAGGSFSSGT